MKLITLVLDGKKVSAKDGQTILDVCRDNGIHIPTFCYDRRLKPKNACKMCLVTVEGSGLVSSCTTAAADGMVVETAGAQIVAARMKRIEDLLAEHDGDCIGPCRDGCPAHCDVEGYLALIKAGNYHDAVRVMKERYILPSVLGRVCPAFCEGSCRRGLVEGPVAIRQVKKFAADEDLKAPWMPELPESTGKKIAIVGGGPAGLSCAYYLRTKGHDVTIYDAMEKLGGMMRYGIPEYRLSREVLDKDIAATIDTGITVKTGTVFGKDITLDELKSTHDAVFLGVGAWKSTGMNIENEALSGIIHGTEFLRKRNSGEAVALGKNVIVVGGGNTAIDVARTAVRAGSDVTLVYRRSRNEMPANEDEIAEAEEEGVKLMLLVNPVKFHGDGKIENVELVRMELGEPDDSGRRRPVPVDGSNFILEADAVVLAIGQQCDAGALTDAGISVAKGKITVDDVTLQTAVPGVFAGGDCVLGPSTVIESIASGRRAAIMIDLYVKGKLELAKNALVAPAEHIHAITGDTDLYDVLFDLKPYNHWRTVTKDDYAEREAAPRVAKKLRPAEERVRDYAEVELPLTADEVAQETSRCMTCGCMKQSECKLREYATLYGATQPSGARKERYAILDHPFFTLDRNKCIACGRCVAVCDEIQKCGVLSLVQSGSRALPSTAGDVPFNETACVFCGNCLSVCPVGALSEKRSAGKGREWEFTETTTACPYCGTGCEIVLDTLDGKIVRTRSTGGPANDGWLCIKGRYGTDFVNAPDRLTTPLIKEQGTFREASWDEALDLVAARLREIKETYGPDAFGGFSSSRCTNEENYLFQKFIRCAIGTNNVDNCARVCHAPTVAGLAMAFGSGAMTNSIAELENADCIFIIGSNTTEAHPVIALRLKKAAERGATLIVADPRRIEIVNYAKLWLQQRPGTDIALINGILNHIVENGLEDREFIAERTENVEALKDAIKEYTPEKAAEITGVPASKIREAAELFARADKGSIVYTLGITEHSCGTENVTSLANLAMLTGNIGRESTGVNPLRGQNNVQGACDMGALPNVYPGYQAVENEDSRKKMEAAWGVKLPEKKGLTEVELVHNARDGVTKALYIMGEDPVMGEPNMNKTVASLKNLEFLVVQDIFMSETAKLADVVLPAASFAEKEGTFTNTERRVQKVRPALEAPGMARADWDIICDLSGRMGYPMTYTTPSEIMDEIASIAPNYGGIAYSRLENMGLQWPCPDECHLGTKFLHCGCFTRGKGKFHASVHRPPAENPSDDYPFILSTGRNLFHFNVATMTRRTAINTIFPEAIIEMNPADAQSHNIENGDMVVLRSQRGEMKAKALLTDKIKKGVLFTTFHFTEAPANTLTIDALDPISKTPEYKACAVKLEKYVP